LIGELHDSDSERDALWAYRVALKGATSVDMTGRHMVEVQYTIAEEAVFPWADRDSRPSFNATN